jgi:hypothetical protein
MTAVPRDCLTQLTDKTKCELLLLLVAVRCKCPVNPFTSKSYFYSHLNTWQNFYVCLLRSVFYIKWMICDRIYVLLVRDGVDLLIVETKSVQILYKEWWGAKETNMFIIPAEDSADEDHKSWRKRDFLWFLRNITCAPVVSIRLFLCVQPTLSNASHWDMIPFIRVFLSGHLPMYFWETHVLISFNILRRSNDLGL